MKVTRVWLSLSCLVRYGNCGRSSGGECRKAGERANPHREDMHTIQALTQWQSVLMSVNYEHRFLLLIIILTLQLNEIINVQGQTRQDMVAITFQLGMCVRDPCVTAEG